MQNNYISTLEKNTEKARLYHQTEETLCRYLAYRDVPGLIEKYVKGSKALDYGAGTGISTRFLIDRGFDVNGVDVSQAMIEQASVLCPFTDFNLVENGKLPFTSETFDFIFSSFVLFEIPNSTEMVTYLREAARLLKKDGTCILITGSEEMYQSDFLVMQTDFPENHKASSGDEVKIYLPDVDIEFTDYYWSSKDYNECFKKAGMEIKEVHYPLGKKEEPWDWKDECVVSPFVIYVMSKHVIKRF